MTQMARFGSIKKSLGSRLLRGRGSLSVNSMEGWKLDLQSTTDGFGSPNL